MQQRGSTGGRWLDDSGSFLPQLCPCPDISDCWNCRVVALSFLRIRQRAKCCHQTDWARLPRTVTVTGVRKQKKWRQCEMCRVSLSGSDVAGLVLTLRDARCVFVTGRKSRGLHQPRQLHDRQSHRVQEKTVSSPLEEAESMCSMILSVHRCVSSVCWFYFLPFPPLPVQCVQSLPPTRHDVLFCCWEPRGHEPVSCL